MLRVDDFERIRREVIVEGRSQREVARELGHSRHTVRKALEHSSPPGYRRQKSPPRPVLYQFLPIIDAWLEEDRRRPPKQRHTACRIYERLRDEHGYPGSYSAVSRYLQQLRATSGEVFYPLGDLQVKERQCGRAKWSHPGANNSAHT